jgi:uncharacterized MAPEG superfamily protein
MVQTEKLLVVISLLLGYLYWWWGLSEMRKAQFEHGYDNKDPIKSQEGISDRGKRARNAMNNHAEQYAFFAIPALVNLALRGSMSDGAGQAVAALSLLHSLTRFLHVYFYLNDQDKQRSLVFTVGFTCNFALFGLAIASVC